MYLNQTAFRLPRGLGLGGQMQDDLSFRLFLPEEGFENCTFVINLFLCTLQSSSTV